MTDNPDRRYLHPPWLRAVLLVVSVALLIVGAVTGFVALGEATGSGYHVPMVVVALGSAAMTERRALVPAAQEVGAALGKPAGPFGDAVIAAPRPRTLEDQPWPYRTLRSELRMLWVLYAVGVVAWFPRGFGYPAAIAALFAHMSLRGPRGRARTLLWTVAVASCTTCIGMLIGLPVTAWPADRIIAGSMQVLVVAFAVSRLARADRAPAAA